MAFFVTEAPSGRRFIMLRAVIVFPEPDSPTSAANSPGLIEKEILSTALKVWFFEENSTERESIVRIGVILSVIYLRYTISHKVKSKYENYKETQRTEKPGRIPEKKFLGIFYHTTKAGVWRLNSKT